MKKIIMAAVICISAALTLPFMVNKASAKDADGDVVIVIDPGHGQDDPGSIATTTGTYEKDCNLAIAKAMREELCKYDGVKVYLTRTSDEWMTNTGRAMIASALKADFLISIHNNSGSATNSGCIAYRSLNSYYSEATNDMCSLITENLSSLGLKNGGVQTRTSTGFDYEDYYTLIAEGVRAGIPSIIVEHCFLSNPTDEAMLCNTDGSVNEEMAVKMGQADAKAVVTYYNLKPRTAEADSNTSVTLQKGYGLTLSVPSGDTNGISWYSIDKNVASVDENGVAVMTGSGTTNLVYKLSDGTSGYCTVVVPAEEPVALTGGINPTFYSTPQELAGFKSSDVIAFVSYSDGSSVKVKPDSVGKVDSTVVGIQDVEVKYQDMTGSLRICMSEGYTPEVTTPAPTEEATTVFETKASLDTQAETNVKSDTSSKSTDYKKIIKYIAVLLVVVVIGIVFFIIENNRRNRRRRRHRGRRRRY